MTSAKGTSEDKLPSKAYAALVGQVAGGSLVAQSAHKPQSVVSFHYVWVSPHVLAQFHSPRAVRWHVIWTAIGT